MSLSSRLQLMFWLQIISIATIAAIAVAVFVLGGAGGSGAAAASSNPVMVEGRVVSVTKTSFKMETSALGPYCRPPMMCPDFLLAPREYLVNFRSSTVFAGSYVGTLKPSAVTVGSEVVVYGQLTPLVLPDNTPNIKQPQIMWPLPHLAGTITAQGVYLLSPQVWPCWSPLAVPRCLPMVNPGGPVKGLSGGTGAVTPLAR